MGIVQELRRKANEGGLQRLRNQAGFNEGRKFTTGPTNDLALTENTREKVVKRIIAVTEPEKFNQAKRIIEDLSDYKKGPHHMAEKKKDELKV